MDRQLLLHVLPLEAMIGSGEPAGVVTEERGNARLQTGIAVGRWHRLLLAKSREKFQPGRRPAFRTPADANRTRMETSSRQAADSGHSFSRPHGESDIARPDSDTSASLRRSRVDGDPVRIQPESVPAAVLPRPRDVLDDVAFVDQACFLSQAPHDFPIKPL